MSNSFRVLLRESWQNLKQNIWTYMITGLALQVVVGYVAKGLLSFVFNRVLGFAGIVGLTTDTWSAIISHPLALLFFIIYLLLLVSIIYIEFAILTVTVTRTVTPLSFRKIIKGLPGKFRQLLGPQLLVFLFYLILMIPLANLGLKSTLLEHFKIPNSISGELTKTSAGKGFYYTFLSILAYLNLRLIYFLPLYTISDEKPNYILKKSWQLTQKRQFKILGVIAFYTLVTTGLLILFYAGSALVFALLDFQGKNLPIQTLFYSVIKGFNLLGNISLKYVLIIILVEHLASLDDLKSLPYLSAEEVTWQFPKWLYLFLPLTLILWLISNGLSLYLLQGNSQVHMIAHRGDVSQGVENSIPAMQAAHRAGADYSEMDVVMTKDQKFVVSHDNNLERLTGLDKNISDMTWSELKHIKTYQNGHTSHIASLEEFMTAAQASKQKIIIELKPYGYEPDNYIDLFVKEIKRLKAVQGNQVMSQDLDVAEEVERQLPEAQTGYLVPLQFGTFSKHRVDFYAIEEFSYTELAALSAYNQKKDLYVWTINDSSLMMRFLQSPVNGIITDKLKLFKRDQEDIANDNNYWDRVLRLLDIDLGQS
ncbi:glycerophosphoryl diester phosphodiesterase membrane domain-containing protein [Streptococcus dentapri]|uniref:Glycerophosphoryl diester phosphodiesterase membrane domain-containing protein n=1 Tax=Streptococcus dentapri TaxID=573564 RepID=A0ABV8CZC9_9STRE